ncbi:MAG: hypothetical protein KIT36_23965 [Alphaproteobacteria bacterium]|nr:hypothetical protein [Alphaproteobacteria bacterium]
MVDDAAWRVAIAQRARRTRNVAVWSIAFFIAAVPAALIGGSAESAGALLALASWLLGVMASIWAFVLAFRHWETLPAATRWLACLPLLVVLFLMAAAVIVTALTRPTG